MLSDSSLERRLFSACSCTRSGVPTFTISISISTIVVVAVVIWWLSVSVAISSGLLLGFRLRFLLLLSIRVSLCLWLRLGIGCYGLLGLSCDNWLGLSRISLRLSHGLVHISVVIFECTFEQEISGKFFVFVACKVRLSSSLLGEAKRLETLDSLQLLRGHLHDIAGGAGLAWLACTGSRHSCAHSTARHASTASISSSRKSKVGVASEYSIHESTLVALDGVEKLWVLLLGPVDKVLVKAWILSHSLCHHCEILVIEECGEVGIDLTSTTWGASHIASSHAAHGRILSIAVVLLAVVSEALATARSTQTAGVLSCQSLQLLHVDSLKKNTTSQICIVFGHSEGLDAQISRLVRDGY